MLIELPGCPEPLIRQALLRSADEFCRRTHAWSEVQEPIELRPGQRDYDLDAPSGALVSSILSAHVGGRTLAPAGPGDPYKAMPAWLTTAGSSPTSYNLIHDRNALSVYPPPIEGATGQLVVRAAYAPTMSAGALPDFLGQQYLTAVTGGAKAILMALPAKSWTNVELVPLHRTHFENGVTAAIAEELHGRTVGSVSVQPRRFGSWG